MNITVNPQSGELLDAERFFAALRELDARIATVDADIRLLRENLKVSRRHREGLVAELRAAARGDRALPFPEDPPKE